MIEYRLWTPMEVDILIEAWGGSDVFLHVPPRVYEGEARVEFDDGKPPAVAWKTGEKCRLYLPEASTMSAMVHEAGHAIHLSKYPDSKEWSDLKCETFAMLGVVRLGLERPYGIRPEITLAQDLIAKAKPFYYRAMDAAAKLDV